MKIVRHTNPVLFHIKLLRILVVGVLCIARRRVIPNHKTRNHAHHPLFTLLLVYDEALEMNERSDRWYIQDAD